ncbi:flagellar biosynthesis anti-sigma factor FlgM [uncultured Erythrobacter sp.]|uniref:flagellar biosynthesis anti-sigma factor FlgM n=1 Tax=uncultured Erythrobacter sp. TaxID=263913 RepID=UPI00261BFBE2|nr:flagellar biosynthesis anti-sigma factor FlgM [uncultured Erythrobacter sp.]
MPSFELSKLQAVTGPRALSETDRAAIEARRASSSAGAGPAAPSSGVSIEVASPVDAASPPVDTDRVAQIRKALQEGSYPLLPAEIADAMIAARLSFGIPQ